MHDLVFLQCVPHDQYFQWQIEVQIVNFRKFDISKNMDIVVWYPKGSPHLGKWKTIQDKYPEVRISLYEDEGVDLGLYISQLRPHSLKKHFLKYPELSKRILFYHDSDIIFNYLPDFQLLINDNICWQSDTSGYLDYNYLRNKEKQGNIPEHEAINLLCKIGGISLEVLQSYTKKTGGAQCILKGVDHKFWQDIEDQVLQIRRNFLYNIKGSINNRYFKSEAEGFQSWCADMWALNFALWKRGKVTDITQELDFSWATDSYETFLKKPIFHNAGATPDKKDIFYKGGYINQSPLHKDIPLPPEDKASRQYVLAIKDVQ